MLVNGLTKDTALGHYMMAKEMKKHPNGRPGNGKTNSKKITVTDRNSLEMFRMFASKNFKKKKEK